MKNKIWILYGLKTPSTLLVPEYLINKLREKEKSFGGMPQLFRFMVWNSHPEFQRIKARGYTSKIVYQPSGMSLQRINFVPYEEDWERLRFFAYSLRVSMSFLFVLLLMYWEKFDEGDRRVPSYSGKSKLIFTLNISPGFSIIELERLNI